MFKSALVAVAMLSMVAFYPGTLLAGEADEVEPKPEPVDGEARSASEAGAIQSTIEHSSSPAVGTFVGFSTQLRWFADSVLKLNRICYSDIPQTRACRVEEVQRLVPPPVLPEPFVMVTILDNDYRNEGRRISFCLEESGRLSSSTACRSGFPVACCSVADPLPMRFLDYLDQGHDPSDGLFALNRACFDQFPGGRLCHVEEFQESIPPPYFQSKIIMMMSSGWYGSSVGFSGYGLSCLEAKGELLDRCENGPYVLACCGN